MRKLSMHTQVGDMTSPEQLGFLDGGLGGRLRAVSVEACLFCSGFFCEIFFLYFCIAFSYYGLE